MRWAASARARSWRRAAIGHRSTQYDVPIASTTSVVCCREAVEGMGPDSGSTLVRSMSRTLSFLAPEVSAQVQTHDDWVPLKGTRCEVALDAHVGRRRVARVGKYDRTSFEASAAVEPHVFVRTLATSLQFTVIRSHSDVTTYAVRMDDLIFLRRSA